MKIQRLLVCLAVASTFSCTQGVEMGSGLDEALAVDGELQSTMATIVFAPQQVHTTSAPVTVTLKNGRRRAVTLNTIAAGLPFRAEGPALPFTLMGGATVEVRVTFNPNTAGAFADVLRIEIGGQKAKKIPLSGTGVAVGGSLALTTAVLADAQQGVAYLAQLTAEGGLSPYSFSAPSGGLPTGVSLTSSGLLSGTPTASGSFQFDAVVRDAAGATATAQLTLLVTAAVPTAQLTWTASVSSVSGYNVYRGATSGGPYTRINSAIVTSTHFVDSAVRPGQSYYYVVTAVAGEESAYSNEVSKSFPAL